MREQHQARLAPGQVRNLITKAVSIPIGWCWRHDQVCNEDHKPERPKVSLVRYA